VPAANKGSTAAVTAGFLGWTLDAFDYFLVVMSLTAIAREFHKSVPQMAWAITLTLACRPVGAFLFGLVADRYGRRLPLMVDLILFSVIEVLSGLAPGYRSFLLLRAIFGIAMGGEWGVGASLAMEKVPAALRGVLSGLLQEGYAAGYLLAAVAYSFVFPHYGWRPLFFIGGAPALLAVFIRFGVSESEAWEREQAGSWSQLGSGIVAHLPTFGYLVLLMTMLNLASHGTQDIYPAFLENVRHLNVHQRSHLTEISMVGAILGGLAFGKLSDGLGRRRAMVLAFCGALVAIPLWAFSQQAALVVVGAFALQFMVQGAWGVVPAHLVELSPPAIRGFLPGFSYQMGNLIAAGIVLFETHAAGQFGYPRTLALSAAIIFVLGAIVTAVGPERRGAAFGQSVPIGVDRG
jgi:SHS family lactate transporter-like MFS transporter